MSDTPKCTDCKGQGKMPDGHTCKSCGGAGVSPRQYARWLTEGDHPRPDHHDTRGHIATTRQIVAGQRLAP